MNLKKIFAIGVGILGMNFGGGGLLGLIHWIIEDRRAEVIGPIVISILIGVLLMIAGWRLMDKAFDGE